MEILYIIDYLFQSGADRIPAIHGIVPVKYVKDHGFILIFVFEITLHHGQLVQICHQGQVLSVHVMPPVLDIGAYPAPDYDSILILYNRR